MVSRCAIAKLIFRYKFGGGFDMGPIAPKDPVKKKGFFYIMLDKQISSAPTSDGRGACVIYENDGRMISAARITGNVSDEEELKLLATAEGFKKLVYGIGVSVISNDVDAVDFVFQVYGKTDPYNSGTTIKEHLTTDGTEYLIPLDSVNWSDDDDIPGQIRFEFDKPGFLATVNVCFYVNEGYTAPPFEALTPIDTASAAYKNMIAGSVLSIGDESRLKAVIDKAQSGGDVTLAYIGGSITQGAGATPINTACYTRRMFEDFEAKYVKGGHATYIKAGVGGTPSELGIVRYDRDVLGEGRFNPDLVVIEFAVNDAGDETNGECYEGLVRRVLNSPNKPAVILLFSVFVDDYNLEDRLVPIGRHYNLPMVSIKSAVTEQFYKTPEEGRVVGKNRFFYDRYHPANIGHQIMSDSLMALVDRVAAGEKGSGTAKEGPCLSDDFEMVELLDRKVNKAGAVIEPGSFNGTDTMLQACEMNLDPFTTPEFPNNWMKVPGTEAFRMKISCRSLFIVTKDSSDLKDGMADIFVDGQLVKTVNPREIGWTHCNSQLILRGNKAGEHLVEVRMHEGSEDKCFTILGFGVVR